MITYQTNDIARKANIHVNTVRFYEKMNLISPVPRAENNYRIFSAHHLYQILILRHIYLDEWPGSSVRSESYRIIEAMKSWQIAKAKKATQKYLLAIKRESDLAWKAAEVLKNEETKHKKPTR